MQSFPFSARFLALAALAAVEIAASASTAFAQNLPVRFVTFNVDFASTAQEVDSDIQAIKPKADIILFQEAKWVNIASSFGSGFTVHHITNQGDAKAGSALAIRSTIVSQVLATGLQFGVDSNGEDMLDRYIAWADVQLTGGLTVRVLSLHLPPARYQYLQPLMVDSLVDFVDVSPYPVVVGGDWNYTVNNDPYSIQGRTGLLPKGVGIDGFHYDPAVADFQSITELTGLNVNSDHDPVQLIVNTHVPTYVVDNSSTGFSASSNWTSGTSAGDKYGANYRFRNTQAVADQAQWTTSVTAGTYKIYAWWSQGVNRSATAPYILPDSAVVNKNQQTGGGAWNLLGTRALSGAVTTKLSAWTTPGYVVIADAIKYGP